ncbi:MAG: CBS domain-containing protein [Myxococcota bacterium]|jgi:CBS domain-containing protein
MKTWAKVSDVMDHMVPTLVPHANILEAADFLLEQKVTGAPVVDETRKVIGILTEFDCLRLLTEGGADGDEATGTVADYMSREVTTVPPHMDIYYAAGIFLGNRFRRLPVVENGRLVGAITRFDILRAVQKALR